LSFVAGESENVGVVLAPQWGKSTVAKMIGGLKTPDGGEILLNGRKIDEVHHKDRNLAVIYSDFALMNGKRFWQNTAFPLKIRKVDKATCREKALQALNRFGLSGRENEKIRLTEHKKSKVAATTWGERLQLALARASLRPFDLIVFDDIFKHIDRITAFNCTKLLLDGKKTAAVWLSSEIDDLDFCNRVYVVADGKNAFDGTFVECKEFIETSGCFCSRQDEVSDGKEDKCD
jgi:ABC-type multidrug transport system ATPase subunit